MRLKTAALLASALCASYGLASAPAWAFAGDEVTVHPVAMGGGVLLYPGGQYMRVVPPLRQPGDSGGPIHLHMPGKGPRVATTAPRPKPKPKPAPEVADTAAAPTPAPAPTSDLGGLASLGPALTAPAANPRVASAAPPPSQPATAPAPDSQSPGPGLVKQSLILFAPNAPDPAQSALGQIKYLAGILNQHLTSAASRVEIYAYGGTRGDKGSDARRLSLKRALAIRQVLIDDGVSTDRIDLHMQGGVDDSGPADRVDIYIKA